MNVEKIMASWRNVGLQQILHLGMLPYENCFFVMSDATNKMEISLQGASL